MAQPPCDSLTLLGVEEDFTVYASADATSITVSGNWEGESDVLAEEDGNVVGVWNNNVTNELPYESLTICISTMNTTCCEIYVWDGENWTLEEVNNTASYSCNPNSSGCIELMDGNGDFASEEECSASCESVITCTGSVEITEDNGELSVSVYDLTLPVIYSWSTGETTSAITPSAEGVYYCDITDVDGCDYSATYTYFSFNLCDSTWYDANFTEVDGFWDVTLTGYIAESLNDLTDTVVHGFTITPSSGSLSEYANVGSYPHSWSNEYPMSLSTSDTLKICWSPALYADGLDIFPLGWSELCNMDNGQMLCENWFWDGEAWVKSTSGTTSIQEAGIKGATLIRIIDALGREVNESSTNRLLFYVYDNGFIDKKFIVK